MEIAVSGLNHKRATVELREKLAFDEASILPVLAALRQELGAAEAAVLSTCNRVELYTAHESAPPEAQAVAAFLGRARGLAPEALAPVLYVHRGAEAARHLFRVTSSLDSMVVGETQILGQVKDSYERARVAGYTGRVLNPLFQHALHVAKEIHTTTSIGEKNVSVPSIAAKLAEKIFHDFRSKTLLILGAGETGRLTLHAFRERGLSRILVVNRTLEKAQELVKTVGGEAFGLDDLTHVLPRADIVISCLSSDGYALAPEGIEAALRIRKQEPIFLVDIAVPRNIHPEVNRLENVYLFNIDDLEVIVRQNQVEREQEVARCESIIERETKLVLQKISTHDVNQLLNDLHALMQGISEEEVAKLPKEKREEAAGLVRRIVGRILHAPTLALKEEAKNGDRFELLELATRLFGLGRNHK